MLLRDLLLAIPGLISPITSQARPEEEAKISGLPLTTITSTDSRAHPSADEARPLRLSSEQKQDEASAQEADISPAHEEAEETEQLFRKEQAVLMAAAAQTAASVDSAAAVTRQAAPVQDENVLKASTDLASSVLAAWASGKTSSLTFASETVTAPSGATSSETPGPSVPLTKHDLYESVGNALKRLPDEFKASTVTDPEPDPEDETPPAAQTPTPEGEPETETPDQPTPEPETPAPTDPDVEDGTTPDPTPEPEPVPEPEPEPEPEPVEPAVPEELPARNAAFTAEAGRVAILTPEDDGEIAGIRILSQGDHGQVSVNPDNSLSLVLSETPGNAEALNFSYEITYADGDTRIVNAKVDLTASRQEAGWSLGDFYMLETDANDRLVIEHGDNHRKVYVTGSNDGLTAADIARAEGISVDRITAAWLEANPEYGGSEDMALAPELGKALWYGLTHASKGPSSNWLMLERGYEYANMDRLVMPGANGESALHPLVVQAYGSGAAPVLIDTIKIYQRNSEHVVIRDVEIDGGFFALQGSNVLLDNLKTSGKDLSIQNVDRITLRNTEVVDVARDAPVDGSDYWSPHLNRAGGLYMANSTGVLLENNFFDRNGWREGYDYNLSGDSPMPPSMYSHNIYMDFNNLDVTFRDNITMRGASFGAQVRSGGFIENNSFIDNNAAVNFVGGNYRGAGPIGNYTLFLNNVITSAGHKRVAAHEGALSMGIIDAGIQSSLIGNIVAHMADPNNLEEQQEKKVIHTPYQQGTDTYYDDTIIYNWLSLGAPTKYHRDNIGVGELDSAALNQATIQNFAAQLLGKESATIGDLADYLRAQADGALDQVVDAQVINRFFQVAFELASQNQQRASDGETARFIPDDRGDGIRWDNKLNWSTEEIPDAGTIDLGGNRVLYSGKTTSVDDFIFGNFGEFKVNSGRINIKGEMSVDENGSKMDIANSGQLWISGYRDADLLKIHAEGGRFANTGAFVGKTELKIGGDAQALLATAGSSFDLNKNSSLTIDGSSAKAGFDGSDGGTAVLRMQDGSTTRFVADKDGLGQIREFRSGAFGDSPDVTSGVVLNGTLKVYLSEWTENKKASNIVLIDADQLMGTFDDLQVAGLGKDRDALLRVNYTNDSVILVLGEAGKGSGEIRMNTTGDQNFIDYKQDAALQNLWDSMHDDALSPVDDPLQGL